MWYESKQKHLYYRSRHGLEENHERYFYGLVLFLQKLGVSLDRL
jgi:hypothetical protein